MSSWQEEHFLAGIRDFTAGTLSGVAGVVAGHPLDTIRVRMQLSKVGSRVSTKDVWQNMVSSEGVRKCDFHRSIVILRLLKERI